MAGQLMAGWSSIHLVVHKAFVVSCQINIYMFDLNEQAYLYLNGDVVWCAQVG